MVVKSRLRQIAILTIGKSSVMWSYSSSKLM